MIRDDYNSLKTLVMNNGTKDEYGTLTLKAWLSPDDVNYWIEEQKFVWVFVVAFIVFFFSCILLSAYKIYYLIRFSEFRISVAFIALVIIIIANIIRVIYFIAGPVFFFPTLDPRLNIILVTASWPFCLFNILLISLYWEELLRDSFKKRSFIERFRIFWISLCIFIFVVTMALTILMTVSSNIAVFDLSVLLAVVIQIIIGILNLIYCIVNYIRITQVLNKALNMSHKKKKKVFMLRKTSVSILIANIGILLFVFGLIMIANDLHLAYNWRLTTWGLVYIGQTLSELGIIFSFKLGKIVKSDTTRKTRTKSTGSTTVNL